jgi:hypothetical protein
MVALPGEMRMNARLAKKVGHDTTSPPKCRDRRAAVSTVLLRRSSTISWMRVAGTSAPD